jgi:hypothetical protein
MKRFRFSIRDLIWLTLMVALIVGWWLDRSHLNKQLDAALSNVYDADELHAQVESLKGQVEILQGQRKILKATGKK